MGDFVGYLEPEEGSQAELLSLFRPARRQRPLQALPHNCVVGSSSQDEAQGDPAPGPPGRGAGRPDDVQPWPRLALQGEQPSEREQAARQDPINALSVCALWHPAGGMGEGEPDRHADREACDMRPDIGTLTAEAEKGEQHDPGADRRPAAEPTPPRDGLGLARMSRKDAERTEPSGRGPDRSLAGGVHERIQRIAHGSGQENRKPRETGAEQLRHEQADDHAKRQIAHQVAEIDMQSESGDGSPPFAVQNAAGIRSACGQPVDRQRVSALGREEEEQNGSVNERTFDPMQSRSCREPRPPPTRVFALVASELVVRAQSLGRGDAQPDHTGVRDQVGLDADRREHEGSLLGIGKRAEPANLDQVGHAIIRDVIGGAFPSSRLSYLEIV
jgi:hypothetical protein